MAYIYPTVDKMPQNILGALAAADAFIRVWRRIAAHFEIEPTIITQRLPGGSSEADAAEKLMPMLAGRQVPTHELAEAFKTYGVPVLINPKYGFITTGNTTNIVQAVQQQGGRSVVQHVNVVVQNGLDQKMPDIEPSFIERRDQMVRQSRQRLLEMIEEIYPSLKACDLIDSEDDLTMIEATLAKVEQKFESMVNQCKIDDVDIAVEVLKQQRIDKDNAKKTATQQLHRNALQRCEALTSQREAVRQSAERQQQEAAIRQQQQQFQMMQQMMMQMMQGGFQPNYNSPMHGPAPPPHGSHGVPGMYPVSSSTNDGRTQTPGSSQL